MMKSKKSTAYSAMYNMVFTTIIVLLFVSGILFFYSRLSAETRKHIIKIGELNAATSAEQIDRYFSAGYDTLMMAGYTLDTMIRDGRSDKDILDFLLNQSAAISNITSGNCPGYYGYISGYYLDGTGWIPDADYSPTQRPWYIDAQANTGKISIVGPYTDSETHRSVITLSKTLCDGKSVVAMDYYMDSLQKIAEEVTTHGNSYAEIVLNGDHVVIAHSDRSEIGRNYSSEQGTFGSDIVEKLRNTDKDFFNMKHGGKDYIVYTTKVADDWFCISVIDETAALREQKKPLFYMLAAALAIFLTHIIIMIHINKNARLTRQLSEKLTQSETTISEQDTKIGEISRIAFRDALTGVGSKSAFNNLSAELSEKRRTETMPTAVVMIDVNDLKYINDNFGHKVGDMYLRGCCRIICNVFCHSPVFRIGGDEFAAVLMNSDFENREVLMQQVRDICDRICSQDNREPWTRYSVAVGLSECQPDELTLDQALARADQKMYQEKRKIKKAHEK